MTIDGPRIVLAPLVFVVETAIMLAAWMFWHPGRTVALAGAGLVGWLLGPYAATGLAVWLILFAFAWWCAAGVAGWFRRPKGVWPDRAWRAVRSWERWVGSWWRPWWRERWVYRRRWFETMQEAVLTIPRPRRIDKVPRIVKVEVGPFGDVVHVRTLTGHTIDQYERNAEMFAEACGMQSCRVYPRYTTPGRWLRPGMVTVTDPDGSERRRPGLGYRKGGKRIPGQVSLEFTREDVLTEPLAPIPIPASVEDVDYHAVPIGRTEAGDSWTVKVHGSHHLVAGITGSGKGSIMWSIIKGLAPAIRSGHVALWAIDPKGGQELFRGRPLYKRYCDSTPIEMTAMLGELVAEMDRRAQKYKPLGRDHWPTVEEPLILCVIDECSRLFVPLSKKKPDMDAVAEAKARVTLLVNQGRSLGIHVLALLQDPRKEVIDMRDLFPDRTALALKSPSYVDMTLYPGASASGIRCDRIQRDQQGRGFAWNDKRRSIIAVRAAYVSDEEIAELVLNYSPGPRGPDLLDQIERSAAG